ncbi:UDP-N-acetylmuramate dehydrogenase [Halomonas llamarensis]|uniref:UDP-N-acetylenolpyruvoylglucosamine reductase n=1 Tax=Halomonas llamarensis TaxID=2945104 RepID=A0ABT0SMH8_9GAMM|nr:UDP-N-acetylmuramate dehydrogenase [Halomonas llamarensis]MCL7928851.1 UDP-N-acetylmuramate dehydrogenase [Halomonas llamarensis]
MNPEPHWQRDVDLSNANTLRLPAEVEHFSAPETLEALAACVRDAGEQGWTLNLLGGGSNVLLPTRLKGAVIRPRLKQWWLDTRDDAVMAYVGAGVNWHSLVMILAQRGLWGVENLALIPGDCGAAPVQNIGAYGVELSDVLEGVQVMSRHDETLTWLSFNDCAFGYRDSMFKRSLAGEVIITRLALRLSRTPRPVLGYGDLARRVSQQPSSFEIAQRVCEIRREKLPDPTQLPNAGSFFKNPLISADKAEKLLARYPNMPNFPQADGGYKIAAGWLIDQCGLKGARFGAFGVHEHQALVLVHFGGGDRAELLQVAKRITAAVQARFGVGLEIEPRCL